MGQTDETNRVSSSFRFHRLSRERPSSRCSVGFCEIQSTGTQRRGPKTRTHSQIHVRADEAKQVLKIEQTQQHTHTHSDHQFGLLLLLPLQLDFKKTINHVWIHRRRIILFYFTENKVRGPLLSFRDNSNRNGCSFLIVAKKANRESNPIALWPPGQSVVIRA